MSMSGLFYIIHYNTTHYLLLYTVSKLTLCNGLKYGHLLRYFDQVDILLTTFIQVEFSANLATLELFQVHPILITCLHFTVYSEMNFRSS